MFSSSLTRWEYILKKKFEFLLSEMTKEACFKLFLRMLLELLLIDELEAIDVILRWVEWLAALRNLFVWLFWGLVVGFFRLAGRLATGLKVMGFLLLAGALKSELELRYNVSGSFAVRSFEARMVEDKSEC